MGTPDQDASLEHVQPHGQEATRECENLWMGGVEMRPHYITAVKRRQKIFDFVLGVTFTVLFALMGALILIEWLAGCGESWVQADGTRVVGECIFIGGLVK